MSEVISCKMLKLKNITTIFYKDTASEKLAVNDISISFPAGKLVCIIGHNGSGKSTLLKTINGIYKADKGEIFINDLNISRKSEQNRAKTIMYLDQHAHNNLIANMTIYENMVMNSKSIRYNLSGLVNSSSKKKACIEALKCFNIGLESRLNEQVAFLSGGEQQTLLAAKILFMKPRVLLLDEFTSALDANIGPVILSTFKRFTAETNATTLIVTHDLGSVLDYADQIVVLGAGRLSKSITNDIKELTEEQLKREINVKG